MNGSGSAAREGGVRFAGGDQVQIAYRVVGDGPLDIVYVQGAFSHLGVDWELPAFRRFCEAIGGFARLVLFDKRGMGMSDRVAGAVPLEDRMDDIRMVMDAVGSRSAVLMGASEGGPLSILFAAAYPERTKALVLVGAEVRERIDADWPWGEATVEEFEHSMAMMGELWGAGRGMGSLAPSVADEAWAGDWLSRVQVNAATPRTAEAFMRMAFDIDVRHVVPSVRVPTLVLHAVGDRVCHIENGRFLARNIPGAELVEMEGADHVPWFQPEPCLSEIRQFLTGVREPEEPDRVLATVLFTDLVDSTATAARLGDRRWTELLERHYRAVRSQLDRFRGREVKTTGDGFLATFDGPARAIRCATAISNDARELGLAVRSGVHTGEVERLGDDIAGITVHVGSRVAAMAGPGDVFVSGTVRDLVAGSGIEFVDRGSHLLKGVPGEWQILEARSD